MGKSKKKKSRRNKGQNKNQKNKEQRNKEPDHKTNTTHKKKQELNNQPEGKENWESELLDQAAYSNSSGFTNEESTVWNIWPPAHFQESSFTESDTAFNGVAAALNQESPKLTEDTTNIAQGQATANSDETQSRQVNMKIGYCNMIE